MTIDTPYYVLNTDRLLANLQGPLARLRREADCSVLIALKGFSFPPALSIMAPWLDGVSASGSYEARLGHDTIGKAVFVYNPAFRPSEMDDVATYGSHICFNSMAQYRLYADAMCGKGVSCGIRINPQCSTLPSTFRANPCQPYSRLGILHEDMPALETFGPNKIEGIHLHTMCEQYPAALAENIDLLIERYDEYLRRIRWLNLGGGQLFAANTYDIDAAIAQINRLHALYDCQIYVEPCEGIVVDTTRLVMTVQDIVHNEVDIAILDGSAVCHVPDTTYIGWKRPIEGADMDPTARPYHYRLTGCSCYAADVWGDYSFDHPLKVGDRIVIEDIGAYSIVKGNYFNGLVMPPVVFQSGDDYTVAKTYDYRTFISEQ